VTIPVSVYNCVSSSTVIDAQLVELDNVFKIYIEILSRPNLDYIWRFSTYSCYSHIDL